MTDQIHRIADKEQEFPCWCAYPSAGSFAKKGELVWCRIEWDSVPQGKTWSDYGWTHWSPDSPAAPEVRPDELNRPPIGADIHFTGHDERILVTGHTARGFTYSGATRLSIPRLGIHGDGTGEAFLDVAGVSWRFADKPASTPSPAAIAAAREIHSPLADIEAVRRTAAIIDKHFPAQSQAQTQG